MVRSPCSMLFVSALLMLSRTALSQVVLTTPAPTIPTTPAATPSPTVVPTPVATAAPVSTATPAATTKPTPAATVPVLTPVATIPAPPVATATPAPPPGYGSDKTMVFSVITLTGDGLATFNSSLGNSFVQAMGSVLGLPSGRVGIRTWGSSSSRRLLADSVSVQSAGQFSDGVAAVEGLNTLSDADKSGALQAAFTSAGLKVTTVILDSSTTALPSNFQPIAGSLGGSSGLKLWAIIVIAVVGALVVVSLVLCCCWRCLFCCFPKRESEEEEKLPKMIKFGSMKDSTAPYYFANSQTLTPTPQRLGRPLPTSTAELPV